MSHRIIIEEYTTGHQGRPIYREYLLGPFLFIFIENFECAVLRVLGDGSTCVFKSRPSSRRVVDTHNTSMTMMKRHCAYKNSRGFISKVNDTGECSLYIKALNIELLEREKSLYFSLCCLAYIFLSKWQQRMMDESKCHVRRKEMMIWEVNSSSNSSQHTQHGRKLKYRRRDLYPAADFFGRCLLSFIGRHQHVTNVWK